MRTNNFIGTQYALRTNNASLVRSAHCVPITHISKNVIGTQCALRTNKFIGMQCALRTNNILLVRNAHCVPMSHISKNFIGTQCALHQINAPMRNAPMAHISKNVIGTQCIFRTNDTLLVSITYCVQMSHISKMLLVRNAHFVPITWHLYSIRIAYQ